MNQTTFELTAAFLKTVSHPTRLQILERLKNEEELCVCYIYEDLNLAQSNVSQHLKILKDKGILTSRKEGLQVLYRIQHNEIFEVLDIVKNILEKQLIEAHNQIKEGRNC